MNKGVFILIIFTAFLTGYFAILFLAPILFIANSVEKRPVKKRRQRRFSVPAAFRTSLARQN